MATESEIINILKYPLDHSWSIQGFGMLRTYLDDEHVERLHIWDTEQAVDEVSTVHDHPWDFSSRVVRGEIINQRFSCDPRYGQEFTSAQIRCGAGGGLVSTPHATLLSRHGTEFYGTGDSYTMTAPELHESFPSRGAVTVISRTFHADRDIATVCWRTGDWVSAEPRPATRAEIEHFVGLVK